MYVYLHYAVSTHSITRALENTYPMRTVHILPSLPLTVHERPLPTYLSAVVRMSRKRMVNNRCGRQAWSTQNTIFVAILAHVVDLKKSQAGFFNSLIVLTIRSDAYISRSGDFRADNNNDDNDNRPIMHLSVVCPTYPTWGKDGGMVGDMRRKYGPRGGANVTCTNETFRVQR